MDMRSDVAEILYTEDQLAEIVARMGRQISEDYRDKNLFMISVLKGSLIFMADLMRAVTIPCSIDFLSVSSYGTGTTTTGAVRILKDLDDSLEGKDLLIVEDILDSGVTLAVVIAASTPPAPLLGMFAAKFDKDVSLAPSLVAVQTLLSMITMPLVLGLAKFLV